MITLENAQLRIVINPLGGTLHSVYGKESGIEYLWQGDSKYWGKRSPNLFPFVGRLYEKKYTVHGQAYDMTSHGFASQCPMIAENVTPTHCEMVLRDTEETRKVYPYAFEYRLMYTLEGNTLAICCRVTNFSKEKMYFGVGGHPGFNVPLVKGLNFEDYELRFSEPSVPNLVEFSPAVLITGERTPYPIQNDVSIPLKHSLFDVDAVVLSDMPRSVTLRTDRDPHGVRVTYPDMQYIGFWHKPQTDAPYVCIEPWCVLPGREGVVEELPEMKDMTELNPEAHCDIHWEIELW